ncbi:clarin-3 [Carcharodon carcharias]|uniref:clarin-3 n=1 Tax=Carcharodon carcharias TaxID=13397 RepID=UPI001B7ECA04|nr:clarin-3 [Carcharodon carcharias]
MPSLRKKLMFAAGFSVSLGTCMLISAIMATDSWVDTIINCENESGDAVGELKLKYGLFDGLREKSGCPILVDDGTVKVLECLENAGTARVIHILVILFLVFGLLFTLLSAIVALYNSISNPYENICGPISIYTCSSISCVSTFLAMVLFAVNTTVNNLSTELVKNSIKGSLVTFKLKTNIYEYSFWLILLSLALNIATIAIVYVYQHENHTREREQKRPTENVPKDVLMY